MRLKSASRAETTGSRLGNSERDRLTQLKTIIPADAVKFICFTAPALQTPKGPLKAVASTSKTGLPALIQPAMRKQYSAGVTVTNGLSTAPSTHNRKILKI